MCHNTLRPRLKSESRNCLLQKGLQSGELTICLMLTAGTKWTVHFPERIVHILDNSGLGLKRQDSGLDS